MKILAGLNVVLGILAAYASWVLFNFKPIGLMVSSWNSYTISDLGLLLIGVAMVLIALVQGSRKGTFTSLQLIFGQDIAILSIVILASTRYVFPYMHEVRWLLFVIMGAALLVVVTGLLQFIGGKAKATAHSVEATI